MKRHKWSLKKIIQKAFSVFFLWDWEIKKISSRKVVILKICDLNLKKTYFCWFIKKNAIFHGRKSSILILFATRKTITKKNKWKNIQLVRKKTFEYFLLQLTNVTQNIIDLLRATQEYEDRFSCEVLDRRRRKGLKSAGWDAKEPCSLQKFCRK